MDYPKPGIRFRDITTLMTDAEAFRFCIDRLYQRYQNTALDAVVAVDSRGFVFGSVLTYLLGVPLVPVRKRGKLPYETVEAQYELEYGTGELELHIDALVPSSKVIIVDDLIATGGTLCAAISLIEKLQASVIECAVVIELVDLGGKAALTPVPLHSLISFHEDEI